MNNKEIYFTSDHALAAFLCVRGYTLLGAVDTGSERLEFALTHTDLRKDPPAMISDILDKTTEFSESFPFPGDISGRKINFRDFNVKLRMCKKALSQPVTLNMVESV